MYYPPSWTIGLVLAAVVAFVAKRWGALSASGAAVALALGTVSVGAGWSWGFVLVAYFVSSTLLTRYRGEDKRARLADRVDKPGARDAAQVLANGGVFGAVAVGSWVHLDAVWQALGAGALAASAADTWATEVGTLAKREARSILGFHPVPTGTSGGVTLAGTLAAAAGSSFIAFVAWGIGWPKAAILSAAAGGFLGSLLDSVIGASLQARRHCAACNAITEQRIHRCGAGTEVIGGVPWLDNDGVNALATLGGALLGAAVASYF